jgi:hypothetical protein
VTSQLWEWGEGVFFELAPSDKGTFVTNKTLDFLGGL